MAATGCLEEEICDPKGIGRRNAVPIIYTRGTHYEIGYDIGRTFGKLIQDYVATYRPLQETYLPLYETPEGRRVYDDTLACVTQQFPQYVREIQGTADGANVPFYKLFLMHLDDIVPNVADGTFGQDQPIGCSTIICNEPGQEILGHNEDALSETLNHWYLVHAHIIEHGYKEEKFMSLSYAGFLPGYTMGYNQHGLVYSINTLSAAKLRSGKSPRYFLTRALLAAENYVQAQEILRNNGCGAAEGFSVNMTFLQQEGDRMFHNAEIGPADSDGKQSQLSMLTVSPGEVIYHCNKYLRLKIQEVEGLIIESSIRRMAAINNHKPPKCLRDVLNILSDQTDDKCRVYQEINPHDYVKTICTGIFNCTEKTWSIYTDKPNCNEPIVILPLNLEKTKDCWPKYKNGTHENNGVSA
ncbi:beta-alanyl-dopamine/carcinine hydrolase [Prorops nasuta]|uniref:beta-alanyl-dopamine/carcinine hydrolase n=1 Tax=Prorops nasuta TaxID=863751 RepID=UPI0034CD74D5